MNAIQILKEADLSPKVLNDDSLYIATVRKGISGKAVKAIAKSSQDKDLLIKLLETSKSNLSRFYTKELLSPLVSESILDLLKVFHFAVEVFEDLVQAETWMHTSIPALNGEIPIELCDTSAGRKLVKDALLAIEYGEFC